MSLNERQEQLYTEIIDIYVPAPVGQVGLMALDYSYNLEPDYKGVRCKYFQTDEMAEVTPAGYENRFIMDVIDKFHISIEQQMAFGWMIHMVGTTLTLPNGLPYNHPAIGNYWITRGNPKVRTAQNGRDANSQKVFAYRIPPPSGLPEPPKILS